MRQQAKNPFLVISKVICVVCKRDLSVWKTASTLIPNKIAALKYEVIVPDSEVGEFERHTDPRFVITRESSCLNGVDFDYVKRHLANHKERAGWYLQQFIKINACRAGSPEDVFLIWDADTVPLKKLDFLDPEGRLIYYKGHGSHADYFDTIKNILGMQKKVEYSFISQCFPVKNIWVEEFCKEIEKYGSTDWITAVLKGVSGNTASGFSEYESLGTFLTYRHPEEITVIDNAWSHFGNMLIGGIGNLSPGTINMLSKDYDYIAFEHSQPAYGFVRRQIRKLRLFLKKHRARRS